MKNKAWVYLSSSATSGACLVLGVVSGIITARLLGPEGRGELAIVAYFPGVVGAFFPLAVPQALTLFISREPERKSEIATAGFRIAITLGILGAICFAIAAPHMLSEDKQHLGWAVALVCLVSPAMVVNPHMYAIQRGMHRFETVNSILLVASGGIIVGIAGLWLTNLVSPLGIALVIQGLQAIIVLIHVWRLGFSALNARIEWKTYRTCLVQGLKYFVPVIALTLFSLSDRAILIRTTTLEQIGYYSVAFAVTFPLTLAVEAFAQIGFVEVAGVNDERKSFTLALRRFQMAQSVVLVSALMLIPFVSPIIRYAFGEDFTPAIVVAYYLVAAMSLRGLSKALENSLRARDLLWPGTVSSFVALASLAALGGWWVPIGGVQRFGLALVCAETAGLIILVVFLRRRIDVPLWDLWGIRPHIFQALSRNLFEALKPKLM